MPTISKIVLQQKNKKRFSVFLHDGKKEEYAFSVHEDVLIANHICKGMVVSEADIKAFLAEDEEKRAYHEVLHFLSFRMRSEKEVRDYLSNKQYEEEVITKIITKLSKEKYIDDLAFCRLFIQSRVNTSLKGPNLLKQELLQKGVKNALINEGLKEYSLETQLSKATTLIDKKRNSWKGVSTQQLKQKMGQFLVAKGFSFEIAEKCIETAEFNLDDEEKQAIIVQGEKVQKKYQKYSGWEYEVKVKQALLRKGFSLSLIEAYLRENDE